MSGPKKSPIQIIIAMLAAFTIAAAGIYLIPPIYQHIIGKQQNNITIHAAGIILSIISFGCLTAFFSFTNSKNKVYYRQRMLRTLLYGLMLGAIITSISLVYGIIAEITYSLLKNYLTTDYIKNIINLITGILTITITPIPVIAYWNLLEAEEKPAAKAVKSITLTAYVKILIMELILAVTGILIVTIFNHIETGTIQTIIQLITYSIFGMAGLIISYRISLNIPIGKIPHKPIRTAVSLLLCFSITLTSIPLNEAFGQGSESEYIREVDFTRPAALDTMNSVSYQKEPTLRKPKKYYEEEQPEGTLIGMDEYSRTYQTGDNTYVTQIGGEANTYITKDNTTASVDNTLITKNILKQPSHLENAANDYTIKLPLEITYKKGIKLNKDGNSIELIPLGGDYSKAVTEDNAVLYNDVYPGIDYQYTILGDTIKEDIVLNRPTDKHTFRFAIKTKDLTVTEENGIIRLYAPDTDIPIYSVTAPEMIDASGEISTNLSLALTEECGTYIVTLTADTDWLNAPERAYPVRIDPTIDITNESIMLYTVTAGYPDSYEGANGYPYCGYDDGIVSSNTINYGKAFEETRTYIAVNYDFTQISEDARIDSATLSLYHYTAWSKGKNIIGLYTVENTWNPKTITWNEQKNYTHENVGTRTAGTTAGWLTWDITTQVNNWATGIKTNNGFVIKSTDELNMQCEVFHDNTRENKPKLTINWSIPDPVDTDYPLNSTTINLRPITENDITGKQKFDALFVDGIATPESAVKYQITPGGTYAYTRASESYKYPDSTNFETDYPEGTKYKDKKSNWQSGLFTGLKTDTIYKITAQATLNGTSGDTTLSEGFLIYQVKQFDTYPSIARHYGVSLSTLMSDNGVQDTLVVQNNTIFIRNPKTSEAYTKSELTIDDKKKIDNALLGRGLHCEFGYEPINLNTGNFYLNTTDVSIPDYNGDFAIERTYNSKTDNTNSMFGNNWSFTYDESLSIISDGSIAYRMEDGKILYFAPDGNGGYNPPDGYYYTLKKISYKSGTNTLYRYEIHDTDGSYKKFDAWGFLTDVVDEKGFITTIKYDSNYRISSITSPAGKIYTITCDTNGRITAITLPNKAVLKYKYDSDGNLTEYVDANGNSIKYNYDSSHYMTSWYDRENNRIILNTYDSTGRVIKQIDANGKTVTLQYKSNQTVTTDANGNITKYTYDDHYRTTKIEYPDGKTVTKKYDSNANLIKDDEYTYTYDSKGNLLTKTRKDGTKETYQYDSQSRLIQLTDYEGNTTTYKYSDTGDLTKITYADGSFETYKYDNSHRATSHTNPNGRTEYYTYTGAVLSTYKDYKGNVYKYYYNSMNQLITTTAPDGGTSRIMYDPAGNKIGEQTADGAYTEYTLDKIGNTIRITDPLGYASDFEYDGMYNITKATDPQNNVLTYTYDGNGNQLTVTDAEGNTTGYEYDSRNRKIKEILPDKAVYSYTYDLNGNLIKTTDSNGNVTEYQYDTVLNLVTQKKDSLGNITTYAYTANGLLSQVVYADKTEEAYEYDTKDRLIKHTDTTGKVTEYTYDNCGNITAVTENRTRTYNYEYDANNNLIKVTDPLGGIINYTYDSLNRQIKISDESDNITSYKYDLVGRITEITDSKGNVTKSVYDLNGNVTSTTDANGNTTYFVYDEINNLISAKDAKGNITNYSYDKVQRLTRTTDALKGTTAYEYDSRGNIIKVTDPLGNIYTMEYDLVGNAVRTTLPNGDSQTAEYDKLNRITKSVDAAGLTESYTYDAMGRITEVSDNTGTKYTYAYDTYGRITTITDIMGRTEGYEYDDFSRIISYTSVDQNTTSYEYDSLDRVTLITDAEGMESAYVYDPTGNLIEETANEATDSYEYDSLNRLIKATDPLGGITTYEYDANGNLTKTTDANGISSTYLYDSLNELISSTDGNGNTTTYEYDELMRVIAINSPDGGRTEYRYDAAGSLNKYKDANGYITEYVTDTVGNITEIISPKGAVTKYSYDKHNNVTEITDPLGSVTAYEYDLNGLTTSMTQPNGGVYTYEYDEVHRLTKVTTPNGYIRRFTYDEYGNIASETDNMERITTYEYDIMHRVTKVTNAEGADTVYSYDEYGNLTSITEANNAVTSYTYNLLNQITSQTDPLGAITEWQYDPVGNVTNVTAPGGRTTTLAYDNNYNLTTITDPMGYVSTQNYNTVNQVTETTNPLGSVTTYEYDFMGQATKVTDAVGSITQYSYDSHGNITEVTNPLGGVTAYEYDLADRLTNVTDALGRITAYTYDSMGNLTSLTDAEGKRTTYTYDLEGNLTALTDSAGTTELMTYDLIGNLKSIVRPDSTVVTYDYDRLNNLVSKNYDENNSKVIYFYDTMGNRISMTDETGESTYEYDIMGRITSVTGGKGRTIQYTYDECSRLASIIYADKRTVTYSYDLNDRLTCVDDDGDRTFYTYDAIGRVTCTIRPDGSRTSYEYNAKGSLVQLTNTDSTGELLSSFAYEYDPQGYITKETAADSNGTVIRTYTYNDAGELASFTEQEGLNKSVYEYTYDSSGNRIRLEIKGTDRPETITYSYDRSNRLIESVSTINGQTTYTYDANGNLISEQTGDTVTTYEYTVEQRLAAVKQGGELLMAAAYDGDGNRIFQKSIKEVTEYIKVENTDKEETPDETVTEEAPTVEEKPTVEDTADTEEKPTVGEAPTEKDTAGTEEKPTTDNTPDTEAPSTEDEDTQIPAAPQPETTPSEDTDEPETPSDNDTSDTWYEKVYADPADTIFWYGFGQGMLQFFTGSNASLQIHVSDEFCDAWDCVTGRYELIPNNKQEVDNEAEEELQCNKSSRSRTGSIVIPDNTEYIAVTRTEYELTYYVNNVNTTNTQVLMEYAEDGTLKNSYTYGNERISINSVDETDYYLYDGRGSVSQLVNADEIVEAYTYDPFGNVTDGAPEFESFYGYNAEETNPVTGLQYLRARYYDSETGRFCTADSYLGDITEPLTLNRYIYTVNNPVMYNDPSGCVPVVAIITGVIGGIAGGIFLGLESHKKQKENIKNELKTKTENFGLSDAELEDKAEKKINYSKIVRDVFIGMGIGSASGFVGGLIATNAYSAVGTAIVGPSTAVTTSNLGFGGTLVTGTTAVTAGGSATRFIESTLNDVASNILVDANIESDVYNQKKTGIEIVSNAMNNALSMDAIAGDLVVGVISSSTSYIAGKAALAMKAEKKITCNSGEKLVVQESIDDVVEGVSKGGSKTVEINNPVLDNIRTGSALKDDALHAFNDIIDNYAGDATKFSLTGGDGVERTLYQLEGSLNGKQGIFEWIVDPDPTKGVTHRRFIEGVGITGKPNARP